MECGGGILDQKKAVSVRDLAQRLVERTLTYSIDCNDAPRALGDCTRTRFWIDVAGVRIHVHKDQLSACGQDGTRSRRMGVVSHEDLITGVDFLIDSYVRFLGLPGEQATMFLTDPSGNALEFKSFKDPRALFRT